MNLSKKNWKSLKDSSISKGLDQKNDCRKSQRTNIRNSTLVGSIGIGMFMLAAYYINDVLNGHY